MKAHTKLKPKFRWSVLPLMVLLAACGTQPGANMTGAPVAPGSSALAATPEQFSWQCQASRGTMFSINGTIVCQMKILDQTGLFASIPLVRMNPGQPYAGQYLGVALPGVRKYDRVSISSQGAYGANCGFLDCSGTTSYTMDGVSSATHSVALVNGVAAGLTISDGSEVYFAGNSSPVTIKHDGVLRFGINSSSSAVTTGITTTPAVTRVLIERCVDINNQTYACP